MRFLSISQKVACAFLASFCLWTHPALSAEWQWSATIDSGASRAYLWIPPNCQQVRGLILANHNMIEQGILEHATMRRACADLGLAEVWVVPFLDQTFDFNNTATVTRFNSIISALAAASGYDELNVVSVVPLGHSACATFPWNFAAWNPGRTLAVLSVHGDAPQTTLTGNGSARVNWGNRNIDFVPGLMVMAKLEWNEDRLAPATDYKNKHPNTPLALLGDAGHGHFDYSDQLVSFLAMFIRKAAAARLPATAPLDQPVVLRDVKPQDGWIIDRWHKDQGPVAPSAPYASYRGDTKTAFWGFDEEMAKATEALHAAARGKRPQLLSVTSPDADPQSGCGEPVRPVFIPLADGISFKLHTAFMDAVPNAGNASIWADGLPVGTSLGHPTGGGPIVLSWIVGPGAQTATDTFMVRFGRAEYTSNNRNNNIWVLAAHPGDDHYKSTAQQAQIILPANTEGLAQTITFPEIEPQTAGVTSLTLNATASSGLPASYFVLEGPAEVSGSTLRFTDIPPRGKFPIKVMVVATQWGRSTSPRWQTAERVERSFDIVAKPSVPAVVAATPPLSLLCEHPPRSVESEFAVCNINLNR